MQTGRSRNALAGLALAVACGLVAPAAMADVPVDHYAILKQVQWLGSGNGISNLVGNQGLLLQGVNQADGVTYNYYATPNATSGSGVSTPCSTNYAQSLDNLKVWASIAQGALLSGKTVRVYYNWCTARSARYIYVVEIDSP